MAFQLQPRHFGLSRVFGFALIIVSPAVHFSDTITDYADFYSQYAAVGRDNEAQSSALQYASSALADKGINLMDAVTDLQTYQDAANGLVDIISSDNPFMAAVNAHLGSLQDDHTLSEAVENIEVHALLAELQGDPETANALRGQAYAEITTAMAEAGLTSGMGGVSAGILAGKLTGKLDEIAAAHKPNADKPTSGGKTDVDSGEGADYDGADNNADVDAPITDPNRLLPPPNSSNGIDGLSVDQLSYQRVLDGVDDLDVSTGNNQSVFYSGRGAREAAENYASENGLSTLEQTAGGQYLDDMRLFEDTVPDIGGDQAAQIWGRISANYASQASGQVTAIVNNPRSNSIFLTQELPALLQNQNVTQVTVRSINGRQVTIPRGTSLSDALDMIEGF